MSARPPPTFSILIGLVGTEERGRILETLAALRAQHGGHSWEAILADRRGDEVSERIRTEFPEAVLFACEPGTSLPELRTRALERASGRYIAVTEDHCVPSPHWLEAMAQAFARASAGTVAVGGCVENGVADTALHWATFLCEYAGIARPVAEGSVDRLPGMNVAYEAAALRAFDRRVLAAGFWELCVHPTLRASGRTLHSSNAIALKHCKGFTFRLFTRQRYVYSRHFAGTRFAAGTRRWLALAATPLLPPLVLYRICRESMRRESLRAALPRAFPFLAIFALVWAWGEAVGYALGPGASLAEIE